MNTIADQPRPAILSRLSCLMRQRQRGCGCSGCSIFRDFLIRDYFLGNSGLNFFRDFKNRQLETEIWFKKNTKIRNITVCSYPRTGRTMVNSLSLPNRGKAKHRVMTIHGMYILDIYKSRQHRAQVTAHHSQGIALHSIILIVLLVFVFIPVAMLC